jgi:predicted MFS family arabinose efflux permease
MFVLMSNQPYNTKIDSSRIALIWACTTLFYCYQYILRLLPNVVMPELMSKFDIAASDFGTFAGVYYIGYVAIHIPIGLILSRFGSRVVFPICMIIAAVGLMPIIYGSTLRYVILGRLLTGIGSSAAIVGAFQIFRLIFPQHFSRMLGIMVCVGLMTALYITKPLLSLLMTLGMTAIIQILIIGGVLLAILSYFILPKSATPAETKSNIWQDVKHVIFNYKLVFISLLAGLMVGPLEGFADAWGSGFLSTVHGLDRTVANTTIGFILSGMCIGSILLPYLADKTKAYYGITLIAGIIMLASFAYLLAGHATPGLLKVACLILGICCAYQVVILSKIASCVPEQLSGLAGASGNMIIMAFGYIFHTAIGFSMDLLWKGNMAGDLRVYSSEAYIKSIVILPISVVVAVIGFLGLIIYERCR